MKKIVFVLILIVAVIASQVPYYAGAGSHTITTTTEQDVQLEAVAAEAGVSVNDLVQTKFVEHLAAALDAIDRKRKRSLSREWRTFTDDQKKRIEAIKNE